MDRSTPLADHFHQLVDAAPDAMVMIDSSGRIELVNAASVRLFGHAPDEMLGRSVEILIPQRFRDVHTARRDNFLTAPRSRPMGAGRELRALRKDGGEVPVEISLTPLETRQGWLVLASIVDISDRRREEERMRAALREKDVLLGEIHHRVKNNLQIVSSLLALQSARMTDPAAIDQLRDSQSRIRSMALIHQSLYGSSDFARVDFGVFLETLVPGLIEAYGVANRIAVRIDAASVRLKIDAAVPCGLLVNELITNAIKHAFAPGGRGEIRIAIAPAENDWIVLSVSDDGVGIPEHVDPATTTTVGLQLVSLLVGQLGGQIAVHNANPTRIEVRFRLDHRSGD